MKGELFRYFQNLRDGRYGTGYCVTPDKSPTLPVLKTTSILHFLSYGHTIAICTRKHTMVGYI